MNFFRKKKEPQPAVTVSSIPVSEALEYDFEILNPLQNINTSSVTIPTGALPYSIEAVQQNAQQVKEANKITDEIPFELSPTYGKLLSSESMRARNVTRIRSVDWDALCYDFRLEKSVIQT